MNKNYTKRINKTIVYVNFSPYQNSGKILDYMLENFENVLLFCFIFHDLGKKQEKSKLKIFKNGKIEQEYILHEMPVPIPLIFLFLPLRSIIMFLQILWHTIRLRKNYPSYDIYFTVNAFTAWIGIMLKKINIVKKTVFWVWDYYPPYHQNKIISFIRSIYWHFDKYCTVNSDKVIFLNDKLQNLRKDIGILPENSNYKIIPIGTNPGNFKNNNTKNIILGFLGVIKKSQGLDIIFDNANSLKKKFPNIKIEIIGNGPDLSHFQYRAKKENLNVNFFNFVPKEEDIENIISKWKIGLALYIPEEGNVAYYGDPSKIKVYLSYGIPVITTNVFHFSDEIKKEKAGIVTEYNPDKLNYAILTILNNYNVYKKSAIALAQRYNYKKIYSEIFSIS